MAIKALNGFGWYLTGMIVAPACYLVSSQVAAERSKVEAVERAIVKAHKDIRGLETEFDTRSNLAQLERWNGEVMRYSAPTPDQFLESDRELTALRPMEGNGLASRYAAMVVPQGAPQPEATSEPQPLGDNAPTPATAPIKPSKAPVAQVAPIQVAKVDAAKATIAKTAEAKKADTAADTRKALAQKAVATAPKKAAGAAKKDAVKMAQASKSATNVKPVVVKTTPVKDSAVAAMDRKLLKDSSFGDLMQGVKAEARRVR